MELRGSDRGAGDVAMIRRMVVLLGFVCCVLSLTGCTVKMIKMVEGDVKKSIEKAPLGVFIVVPLAIATLPFTLAYDVLTLGGIFGDTTSDDIAEYERTGNIPKLSQVTTSSSEPAHIRREALESLARLNWKPSNEDRLKVYSLFASQSRYGEASALMQAITPEEFSQLDKEILTTALLLDSNGSWSDISKARIAYDRLLAQNNHAVAISVCQQIMANPKHQLKLIFLAIKLGLPGSEDDLVKVLFVYGDKPMAEDYLNSGSSALENGGRDWAASHGYKISTGPGSHRSGWGRF